MAPMCLYILPTTSGHVYFTDQNLFLSFQPLSTKVRLCLHITFMKSQIRGDRAVTDQDAYGKGRNALGAVVDGGNPLEVIDDGCGFLEASCKPLGASGRAEG